MRPLVAVLALSSWGLGQASALGADVTSASASAVVQGPHVEVPGDHTEHASHDESACRWCQALQLGAESHERSAAVCLVARMGGAVGSDAGRPASAGVASGSARAPPPAPPTA